MKGYTFSSKYFTSKEDMMYFVNGSDIVKRIINVVPEGAGHYTLFYLW